MRRQGGFSLVELMAALVIGSMLLGGVWQLVSGANAWMRRTDTANQSVLAAHMAFDRMVRAAAEGRMLILPLGTAVRSHFAVTLPAGMDRNGDGFPDADNDFDGLLDEDPGSDLTNDGDDGLRGFDDDADGSVDEGLLSGGNDDDEDGLTNEDGLDGIDNDFDGRLDEDPGSGGDEDGDGLTDEDGYDPLLYFLSGTALNERVRVPWDANGSGSLSGEDVFTSALVENVTLFEARREVAPGGATLLHLKMSVLDGNGDLITLETSVRVGSRA